MRNSLGHVPVARKKVNQLRLLPLLFLLAVASMCPRTALASRTEWVVVTKVMDDKALITRSNSESYLIETGAGCSSLWRSEGRRVLVSSPGMFLGVGSKLILTNAGQQCRIWNSEKITARGSIPQGSASHITPRPTPSDGSIDLN